MTAIWASMESLHPYMSFASKDQVVLGTDYPFPLGERCPGQLIESMESFSKLTKVCCYNT
jgi:hypothetical protein